MNLTQKNDSIIDVMNKINGILYQLVSKKCYIVAAVHMEDIGIFHS